MFHLPPPFFTSAFFSFVITIIVASRLAPFSPHCKRYEGRVGREMAHQSQFTPSTTKHAPSSSEMHLAEDEAAVLLLGLRGSGGPASSSSSPQPQPQPHPSSSSCSGDSAVASTSRVKLDETEPLPKSSGSPCATPVRVIEGRMRRASLTRSQSDEDARRVRGRKSVKEEDGKRTDEEEEEGDTSSSADAHLRRGSRHRKQVERPNMVKTPGAGLYKGTSHRKRHSGGHARGSTAAAKAELNGVSVSRACKRQGPESTADCFDNRVR